MNCKCKPRPNAPAHTPLQFLIAQRPPHARLKAFGRACLTGLTVDELERELRGVDSRAACTIRQRWSMTQDEHREQLQLVLECRDLESRTFMRPGLFSRKISLEQGRRRPGTGTRRSTRGDVQ